MMQLSDSFFPTGLFATSSGLESLFLSGQVSGIRDLIEFGRVSIEQQVGPGDCVILANAVKWCAAERHERVAEADSMCSAMKTVRETRDSAIRSGVQLARCTREFRQDSMLDWYWQEVQGGRVDGIYPVSFGVCCNSLGIDGKRSTLMFLYGFAASIAGAALRLGMIQHFEGQKMIHELKPLMARMSSESCKKDMHDAWQFAPQMEINQMRHETMDSKMFIT